MDEQNYLQGNEQLPLNNGNILAVHEILSKLPFVKTLPVKVSSQEVVPSPEVNGNILGLKSKLGTLTNIYPYFQYFQGLIVLDCKNRKIKSLWKTCYYIMFVSGAFGIYKQNDDYICGFIAPTETDGYGNMTAGTFIPYSWVTHAPNKEKSIVIDETNYKNLFSMRVNVLQIPWFVFLDWYIGQMNILWTAKEINARQLSLTTLLGIDASANAGLQQALNNLFNLTSDNQTLSPIGLLNISDERLGDQPWADISKIINIQIENEQETLMNSLNDLFNYTGHKMGMRVNVERKVERLVKDETNFATDWFDVMENALITPFKDFEEYWNENNPTDKIEINLLWNCEAERKKLQEAIEAKNKSLKEGKNDNKPE